MQLITTQNNIINLNSDNVIWTKENPDGTFLVMLRTGNIINTTTDPLNSEDVEVPDDYEIVKYIEMNGGQFTVTQFTANEHSIFKIDIDIVDGATGTSISAESGNGAKTIIDATIGDGDVVGLMYDEECYDNPILYPNGRHTYVIDYHNHQTGYDNNYEAMERAVTYYSDELPFMIGGWYEDGDAYYLMTGKVYRLEVLNGNNPLVNLVPVIRKIDNKPGFFDITKMESSENPFLINLGEGEFGYEKQDGTYVSPELS